MLTLLRATSKSVSVQVQVIFDKINIPEERNLPFTCIKTFSRLRWQWSCFLVATHLQIFSHQPWQENPVRWECFHLSKIFLLCFHCICFKISQKTQRWKLSTRRAPYSRRIQALVMFLTQADAEVSLTALQPHKHTMLSLCSSGRAPDPAISQTDPYVKAGKSKEAITHSHHLQLFLWSKKINISATESCPHPTARSCRTLSRKSTQHGRWDSTSSPRPIWFDLTLTD